MKKVCHVISGYYREDTRVFHRQCKTLSDHGFEVSILTNDGNEDEIIDNIKIYSTKSWSSRLLILLFAKSQFIKKINSINADIYQLHSPELLPLINPIKKLGKKVIYDAHEDMPNHILEKEWIPLFLRPIISNIFKIYQKIKFKQLDHLISPHHHIIENSLISNSTVIPNFPLIREKIENNKLKNYKSRKNIICYVGTVYSFSNQEEIFEALNSFNEIEYHIAGYIDESSFNNFKKFKSFHKLTYYGRVSQKALKLLFRKCTIGIVVLDYRLNLGYYKGSFGPNKIFEYMEAGLPIICTNYKIWNDIIKKYNCGICVEPNNVEQLKQAIYFLENNKEKAYEMGMNGMRAVREEYN